MTKPLKVGDKVVTKFRQDEETIVRRITSVREMKGFESGYCASADGGEPCPTCARPFAEPIHSVDSGWFVRVPK